METILAKYCEIDSRQGQGKQKNYILKPEYRIGFHEVSKKIKYKN